MSRLKGTRLKLVIGTTLLFFVEAIVANFVKVIPIGELFIAQGGLVISYVTGKTVQKKYENNVSSNLPVR